MNRNSHYRSYLHRERCKPLDIINGVIVEFNYSKPKTTDRKPLVLVLYRPRDFHTFDGLNLNYLTLNEVGDLFKILNNQAKVVYTKINNSYYKRFQIKGQVADEGIQPDQLYENVIKKRVLNKYDCYRTYKTKLMRNLSVVDLDFKASTRFPKINEHIYVHDRKGTDAPYKEEQLKKEKKRTSKNVNMQGDKYEDKL